MVVGSPSGQVPKQMDDHIIKVMHSGQMTLGQKEAGLFSIVKWSWSEFGVQILALLLMFL